MIVCMRERYSTCFKLISSFTNDDQESEGNVKYRKGEQITKLLNLWVKETGILDGGGLNICVFTDISITNNFFFFD